jgi:hypothetical protein
LTLSDLTDRDRSLADLPESLATGAAAAFFVRVRTESGSALVNFVWRHLATLPEGAAEWCWNVVRMTDAPDTAAVLSAQADKAAAALAGPSPRLPHFSAEAAEILAAYNRNNAMNLARMGLLLSALDAPAPRQATVQTTVQAVPATLPESPRADTALPPLPSFATLGSDDTDAIAALSRAGPGSTSGVSPSLWRHLTVQPGLVPAIADQLANTLSTKIFAAAHADLRAAATPRQTPATPAPPSAFDSDLVRASVMSFAERIAELTLAGRILAIWLTPAPQQRADT